MIIMAVGCSGAGVATDAEDQGGKGPGGPVTVVEWKADSLIHGRVSSECREGDDRRKGNSGNLNSRLAAKRS